MDQHWVATDFGDLDVLRLQEIAVPSPGPGEVTIAVRAAGMNPADYKHLLRQGSARRCRCPSGTRCRAC